MHKAVISTLWLNLARYNLGFWVSIHASTQYSALDNQITPYKLGRNLHLTHSALCQSCYNLSGICVNWSLCCW